MPLSLFLSCTVISIGCDEHPVWQGHRTEAKRGQPCGPRITKNCEAMVSFLLTCATPWLSLIAEWCLMGETPSGSAVYVSPSAPPINAQRVARFDPYRTRNCLPPQKLRREIQ